jgi:hypothetical protein
MATQSITMDPPARATSSAGRFEQLTALSDAELDRICRASKAPTLETMVGYEWRGYNTPRWTGVMGIQKFIKGFFPVNGAVEGYNLRVKQNGLQGPWLQLPTPDAPTAFGFFTVKKVLPQWRDNHYPDSLLLNYGESGRNRLYRFWDDLPMKALRDYIVQPDPSNPDLMIGKAFIALGPARMYSNFFIIERLRPGVWKPGSPALTT